MFFLSWRFRNILLLYSVYYFLFCLIFSLVASCQSSLSLTGDRPPDLVKVTESGKDVTLSWDFSYKDSASIRNGPWEARDVLEISFGIWKSIDDRLLLKKIVTVDNSGKFEVRSGYESKMNCSHSINKLAFKLKGFSFEDQATYGINVEFGRLDQNPLTDSTRVSIGASYSGQDENFNMRNGKIKRQYIFVCLLLSQGFYYIVSLIKKAEIFIIA